MKLWINEHDFIEIDDNQSLPVEIAARSRSVDWWGLFGNLPDPDPILRKIGQDISVYRRLLSDGHVWSCYQSRKSGTLSCEWEICESSKSSRANKRAYQMISDMISGLDVYQIITDMLDAPFFGMSPIEVVWKSAKNAWIPDRIAGKPPEWFMFDPENHLKFMSKDNMIDGEEIPEYKFLLCRHHSSYQNPYGERLLSRCFWPAAFKKGGFKYWAVFTEKYGMPWVIGRVPGSTNDTERARLMSNLAKMVADAVAVINNDDSVEIKEAAGKSASADIYEKLISTCNREFSKAILGQTLTTELDKGGSFAATKEHMEVRADLVDQDKRMVKSAFNLLFQWIVDLNFAGAAAPTFSFFEEEDIQKDLADRDEVLTKQGVRFKTKYYQRTYNLEEDDFELVEPRQISVGQFAETVDSGPNYDARQQEIEELADDSLARAAGAWKGIDAPVRKLIQSSSSLEEVRDRIFEIYGDLDPNDLEKLVRNALVTAILSGAAHAANTSRGKR